MVEVDVRDWLRIVGITLDEELIEAVLRESEIGLRSFVTVDGSGVGFDSPAVLATATRRGTQSMTLEDLIWLRVGLARIFRLHPDPSSP